jgi:hypothetical protein
MFCWHFVVRHLFALTASLKISSNRSLHSLGRSAFCAVLHMPAACLCDRCMLPSYTRGAIPKSANSHQFGTPWTSLPKMKKRPQPQQACCQKNSPGANFRVSPAGVRRRDASNNAGHHRTTYLPFSDFPPPRIFLISVITFPGSCRTRLKIPRIFFEREVMGMGMTSGSSLFPLMWK